jgi:hypothetical protein
MNVVAKKNFNWKTSFVEACEAEWYWAKQPSGSISLPDFIQLRAKGEAKMADGHVYLKKPGADPELVELFKQRIADAHVYLKNPGPDPELTQLMQKRMNDAYKAIEESISKSLYDDKE